MHKLTSLALLTSATLLSACGGGSTGGSGFETQPGPITIPELNTFGREIFALQDAIDNNEVVILTQAEIVDLGSASFSGFMVGGIEVTNDAFAGRAEIDADFTNGGSMTGDITDIRIFPGAYISEEITEEEFIEGDFEFEPIPTDAENHAVAGSLSLSGGELSVFQGIGAVTVEISGDVTVPAVASFTDQAETYSITGPLQGAIADDGTLILDGEVDASGTDDFELEVSIFAR